MPNGNRLRELRKRNGRSLLEVAKVADKDPSVVLKYEKGEVQMPDVVKLRVADFYGVPVAYMMNWPDQPGSDDDPEPVAA